MNKYELCCNIYDYSINRCDYLSNSTVLETTSNISDKRMKKAAKTKKDVDSIVLTLSKKERDLMRLDEPTLDNISGYFSIENGRCVVHRVLYKIGNIPVSFFDLIDEGDCLCTAVATRAGKSYRGKGYANKCVKEGIEWWDRNKHKFNYKYIVWWVETDNKGSRKLAEDNGFVLNMEDVSSEVKRNFKTWCRYIRK